MFDKFQNRNGLSATLSLPAKTLMVAFVAILACQFSLLPITRLLDSASEIGQTVSNIRAISSCIISRKTQTPVRRGNFLLHEERVKGAPAPHHIEKFRAAALDCVITADTNLPRNLLEVWVGRYHPHLPC